jgi:hypothetical protein
VDEGVVGAVNVNAGDDLGAGVDVVGLVGHGPGG